MKPRKESIAWTSQRAFCLHKDSPRALALHAFSQTVAQRKRPDIAGCPACEMPTENGYWMGVVMSAWISDADSARL
jgi:hypothetical protein